MKNGAVSHAHHAHHAHRARLKVMASVGLIIAIGTASCGQKAAPDLDPAGSKTNGVASSSTSSASTTTALTTTTTTDPGTLPQTMDKPDAGSAEFRTRMEALWHAIVTDQPESAITSFFPLTAYQQVKDVTDPTGDWNNRLVGALKREIADYHKRLASQLAQQKAGALQVEPQFVSVNVPSSGVQWIKEKVEYNKIGYYRVFDSKLNYTINGKPFSFNIKSLISWRGRWYVVHLASI